MSISEAIARVRQGASRSSSGLLDGALSYLGVRLKADLVGRLKSDSVPPPLRPLAARLASLIKLSDPPPYDPSATQQLEVVSLDRALTRAAQQQRTPIAAPHAPAAAAVRPTVPTVPTVHGAQAAADVCPFTGLRADGSVAEAGTAQIDAAQSERGLEVGDLATATRLPIPTAANDASSVVSTAVASGGDLAPAAQSGASTASAKPKKPAARRPSNPPAAKPEGEKRKEKLAAPQDLTNTSARSATRPVKQPSGKGQTSSRKKA
jgi:hypothetical protein